MHVITLVPPRSAALSSLRPHALSSSPLIDVTSEESIANLRQMIKTLRPTSRGKIIGQHPTIRTLLETIDRVARSMCTVLVTGESGTGKELVVAALHDASTHRTGPLVTINCGAIPLELVESELFGHAKGAFTGAQTARRGHVATAEGGTLFLDEIGELPLSAQVKLLRVLQQREYTPVGESRAVKCDVRIVAATNRDLAAEVAAGRFREDLYYRLNVIRLPVPALRDRGGDVRVLAMHFYRGFAATCGRGDLRGFSEAALAAITTHSWPGNVRALENAIERGVLLARGPFIEHDDIFGFGAGVAVEARVPSARADARCEPGALIASAAPPAPRAAPFGILTPAHGIRATVLPFTASAERRGSNPAFPRCLPETGMNLSSCVESYQNHLIRQALSRTGGNKNKAAQLLGLNRTTLVEIIRRRAL
jgi:sigma-54 specific flagellar transcriptional regulator A